jgi:hypothetical protein
MPLIMDAKCNAKNHSNYSLDQMNIERIFLSLDALRKIQYCFI